MDYRMFTPSQRWRTKTANDGYPYCKMQRYNMNIFLETWRIVSEDEGVVEKYLNYHCLETNAIEGTFQFNQSVSFTVIICCECLLTPTAKGCN